MNLKSVARDIIPSTWKTGKQNKLQTTNWNQICHDQTTLKGETGDLGRREEKNIQFNRLLPIYH
jgi:hypothetical protein